jgi:hypothetical protein
LTESQKGANTFSAGRAALKVNRRKSPSIRGENSDIVDAIPLKSATYRDEATGIRLAAHTGGEKADFYIAHNLAVGYLF